ncbi:unnamed protein product, partial [Rotaria sp. Silwood1]
MPLKDKTSVPMIVEKAARGILAEAENKDQKVAKEMADTLMATKEMGMEE